MKLFRDLSEQEEREFRDWARKNYKPLTPINGVWHPCVQDECAKINAEKGTHVWVWNDGENFPPMPNTHCEHGYALTRDCYRCGRTIDK